MAPAGGVQVRSPPEHTGNSGRVEGQDPQPGSGQTWSCCGMHRVASAGHLSGSRGSPLPTTSCLSRLVALPVHLLLLFALCPELSLGHRRAWVLLISAEAERAHPGPARAPEGAQTLSTPEGPSDFQAAACVVTGPRSAACLPGRPGFGSQT